MSQNILIIDDDTDFLQWLETGLISQGYNVSTATTARDGLKILNNNKIHLIILDIYLPDIDGFTIIKELKTNRDTKDVPVIVVSGVYKKPEDEQKSYELGADDYLKKPFSYKFLNVKVKKLLPQENE